MYAESIDLIKSTIKTIPDYPKTGILFRDITSLLEVPSAYQATINLFKEHYQNKGVTKILGAEARGFLFGAPLALALNVPFIPVRKPGKLPRETFSEEYELEYGTDKLEIHVDALTSTDKVLIVDDLLATGGTVSATVNLVRRTGAEIIGAAFVINLPDIGGKTRLEALGVPCFCLTEFDGH
ncbi:adenine phosphoribosyltransferase [Thorsellia anophelis DSM 18579]|uniref:Adenine phosphoribosyltransferase n=2 Tax=Thorsellia anophelis TaxID=336804 RepID=A0A1H9YNE7_9GAMM|nr:adenine phosphoribosyltransferase [Thorsellia anophelis DSM 18579]